MKQYFALGAYTEPILFGTGEVFQGKGRGISICALENGQIEVVSEMPVCNPSFLCVDEVKRKIYAVNEMKEYQGREGGGITELSYGTDFSMSIEGTWNVGGTDPCHIAVSPNGRLLTVANFASGSLSTFPLDAHGRVCGEEGCLFQHAGSSAHPVRQSSPHAHSCIFTKDSKLLYVPDLGLDQVVAYRYANEAVTADPALNVSVPAGSGPRYGEFSMDGKHFYLINEISSKVMHFAYANGRLTHRETVHTLPDHFDENNICSDLHLTPDGTKLYASNRGHDSLAAYQVETDGSLSFLERQPCGGRTPRNFAIDPTGEYLIVGNQDSDSLNVFKIDRSGHLAMISQFATGSPVCIRFFNQ